MKPTEWQPTASLKNLQQRSELLWTIRQYFHSRAVAEVQTPILSHDTVIDRHIDPISLPGKHVSLPSLAESTLYLQTSPEFCMKRLLAAGMTAIYEITPVFRAAERGEFHNPEFTMLEWYRVGDDLPQGIDLLRDLIRQVMQVEHVEITTYQIAFEKAVHCDPLEASVDALAARAVELELGVGVDWSRDRDDWLNLLFSEVVQPKLGLDAPTIVTHYPASQSALARLSATDRRTAERYELFVRGIELANGYHELLDAEEFAARNQVVLAQRSADGKPILGDPSRLLAAMRAGLPACSGCALGIDRLLMVMVAAERIEEVIAFPIERA